MTYLTANFASLAVCISFIIIKFNTHLKDLENCWLGLYQNYWKPQKHLDITPEN